MPTHLKPAVATQDNDPRSDGRCVVGGADARQEPLLNLGWNLSPRSHDLRYFFGCRRAGRTALFRRSALLSVCLRVANILWYLCVLFVFALGAEAVVTVIAGRRGDAVHADVGLGWVSSYLRSAGFGIHVPPHFRAQMAIPNAHRRGVVGNGNCCIDVRWLIQRNRVNNRVTSGTSTRVGEAHRHPHILIASAAERAGLDGARGASGGRPESNAVERADRGGKGVKRRRSTPTRRAASTPSRVEKCREVVPTAR